MPALAPPAPWLDRLYPLTHFVGHRPPTVRDSLQPNDEGYRKFHATFNYVVSFSYLDPFPSSSPFRGGSKDNQEYDDDNDEYIEPSWTQQAKCLFWSRLKETFHILLATFATMTFIALIGRSQYWTRYKAPIVLAGYATECVIVFSLYSLPAAQPYAIFLGNTMSSIMGVAISKGFAKQPTSYAPGADVFGVNWAAPAVATSLAVVLMNLLGIVHPPGAAMATLATTTSQVVGEGWQLVPQVMLISLLFIAMGLTCNNVGGRQYPTSWYLPFFPKPPSKQEVEEHRERRRKRLNAREEEQRSSGSGTTAA